MKVKSGKEGMDAKRKEVVGGMDAKRMEVVEGR